MRAIWSGVGTASMTLDLQLEGDDPVVGPRWCSPSEDLSGGTVRLLAPRVSVVLPRRIEPPHPDLLALAAYAAAAPWVGRRLALATPISSRAAEGFARAVGVEAGPVDDSLAPRESPRRAVLAYSGGVDSIAAAELLKDDVVLVHSARRRHPWVPRVDDIYQTAGFLPLVAEAGRRGWRTEVVGTDVDYVCALRPRSPTSFADGIGAILLADDLESGGVAWGNVLGTLYLEGGRDWAGMREPTLPALFAAVGLDYLQPTAAVTEAGSTLIARESSLGDLARSCAVAADGGPCHWCEKCIRKALVTAAVCGEPLDPRVRSNLSDDHPVMTKVFNTDPFHASHVVGYALARVDLAGTPLAAVRDRMGLTPESTRWAERYFRQGLSDFVSERWRASVETRLGQTLRPMDADDEARLRAWPEDPATAHR